MTKIIKNIREIPKKYKIVYCDIWGCIHNGKNVFPEAISALKYLKDNGLTIILLTNSPRTKKFVKKQINKIGVPKFCYDEIITSGDASLSLLIDNVFGEKVFHIGPDRDLNFFLKPEKNKFFKRVSLNKATGIVCTGLFDEFNEKPSDYLEMLNFSKEKELKFLCVNPDIKVNYGEKELWCAGSIAQIYSKIGGEVIYCGKPYDKIYKLAEKLTKKKFNKFSKDILCIGDGINTDIKGGFNQGYDTLFICSGIEKNKLKIPKDSPYPNKEQLNFLFKNCKFKPTMAIDYLK